MLHSLTESYHQGELTWHYCTECPSLKDLKSNKGVMLRTV